MRFEISVLLALVGNAIELGSTANGEVCVLKNENDPTPGFKIMSMSDVRDNMNDCKEAMTRNQIAVLSDGKFDGNNLTAGSYFNNDSIDQKLVMKAEVCVLKEKGDPAQGFKTMSMDEVSENMDACKEVMDRWKVAALTDGKFDGSRYGNNLTAGDFMNDDSIGQYLVMESKVCVLMDKSDPALGYRIMSMDDVTNNMTTCESIMTGWEIGALADGKFDGAEYGNNLTAGDYMNDNSIDKKLVMTDEQICDFNADYVGKWQDETGSYRGGRVMDIRTDGYWYYEGDNQKRLTSKCSSTGTGLDAETMGKHTYENTAVLLDEDRLFVTQKKDHWILTRVEDSDDDSDED